MYNSIVRRKGVVVPFGLSKEELQQFYALLDQLTIAILQKKVEEPQVPPRPALRLVKPSGDPTASSVPRSQR